MIIEERIYTLCPGQISYFWDCYSRADVRSAMTTMRGSLVGYFSVEVGDLNKIIHLWRFSSHEQRQQIRGLPLQDPVLREHIKRLGSAILEMENKILIPSFIDFLCPLTKDGARVSPSDLIEERIYTLRPGATIPFLQHYSDPEVRAAYEPILPHLIGFFSTDIGPLNQVVHFWRFKDASERRVVREKVHKNQVLRNHVKENLEPLIMRMENRLLMPSPLKHLLS